MNPLILHNLLHRKLDTNKYNFGHVLVIGGSPGMVGAPLLAAEAALRIGAGLVTIASHGAVIDKLEKRVKEVMTLRLSEYVASAHEALIAFVHDRKVSSIIIGPGQTDSFIELNRLLLHDLTLPVVIDAGGLALFHKNLVLLTQLGKKTNVIITPHGGEYQRLTGSQPPIATFAQTHHITVVLKDHPTRVAHPNGSVFENTTGNPGLATAGTGDVLAGIIGGLLAQSVPPAEAAEIAVYLHGLAGDIAASHKTQPGMIASDVTFYLPDALHRIADAH